MLLLELLLCDEAPGAEAGGAVCGGGKLLAEVAMTSVLSNDFGSSGRRGRRKKRGESDAVSRSHSAKEARLLSITHCALQGVLKIVLLKQHDLPLNQTTQ